MKSHLSIRNQFLCSYFSKEKEVMESESINLKSQGIGNVIALNLSSCLVPRFL